MSPTAAVLTVAIVVALIAAFVALRIRRSGVGIVPWVLYALIRLHSALLLHARTNRRCPWPVAGPAIIVANHRSPVDPVILYMNHHLRPDGSKQIRVMSFMMAREYFEVRALRWMFEAVNSIPVDRKGRDMAAVKDALTRLKNGEMVALFPEGGINTGTDLLPGNTGVAWLALKSGAPVYPTFIEGSPTAEGMIAPFLKSSRVRIIYGDPIDLSAYHGQRTSREVLEEVTTLIMTRLAELGGVNYTPRQTAAESSEEPDQPQSA